MNIVNNKIMRMNYTKQFLVMCILLLGVVFAHGQTTATTSGGEASGSGGTASYSVGQVAYQNHSRTNGSVAEGVQQPFEISVVTGLEKAKGVNFSITAYPNPTTDYLTLSTNEFDFSDFSYQLYDMQGKLLQSKKITSKQTGIFMRNLVSATYFVKVIQGNKEVKTFKIIKNKEE